MIIRISIIANFGANLTKVEFVFPYKS